MPNSKSNPLVILDRDGVINHDSAEFIKSTDEWLPIKGSLEAITQLSQNQYDVVIVTNQSGIGRGLLTTETLSRIHAKMIEQVQQLGGQIKAILFCPHHPDEDCECRKPKAGMYHELTQRLGNSYEGTYSVGDSTRDLIAAQVAGASPVLVKTGKGRKTLKEITSKPELSLSQTPVFDDLSAFAQALLNQKL